MFLKCMLPLTIVSHKIFNGRLPSKENHPEVPVAEKKLSDVSDEPVAPLSDPSLELCFSESYGKKRKNIRSVKPSPVSELKGCIVNDGNDLFILLFC